MEAESLRNEGLAQQRLHRADHRTSLEEWICLLPSITVSPILSLAHTDTAEQKSPGFSLLEPSAVEGIYSYRQSHRARAPLRRAKFVESPRIPQSELGSPTHTSTTAKNPDLDTYCPVGGTSVILWTVQIPSLPSSIPPNAVKQVTRGYRSTEIPFWYICLLILPLHFLLPLRSAASASSPSPVGREDFSSGRHDAAAPRGRIKTREQRSRDLCNLER
ncbi:hypothetical protein EYF80_004902 [Liparis tanakae]|uniref:Uncharacterized protein n=1 Tax=Liparis tanakae TaxID=230148 RepID=A0A4Z2J4B0_9TELE|nr:hypothetical protein EYF80_004902 [Liparis tanakae]